MGMRDLWYGAGAALSVSVMSVEALASGVKRGVEGGFGDMAGNLGDEAFKVGDATKMGAFGVGVLFIANGMLKLKQAADTQGQQVKYGDGLWRLAVGAGLAAVPAVMGASQASMGLEPTEGLE